MAKNHHESFSQGQNFLRSPSLVRSMVEASSISGVDTVYEIGPGRGIITAELARTAQRVIAIESDPLLVRELRRRFLRTGNVQVLEGDFLRYRIHVREYKIFANIPYHLTADIVRKILYVPPCPDEAYLVMQKEAAERFTGIPRETQFSILAKPLYHLQIIRSLRRTDFDPVPGVKSVLLHIRRRHPAFVSERDLSLYRTFVRYGFGRWKRNIRLIFKPVFSHKQWKRLSQDLRFQLEATPSELSFEQWLGLFDYFKQTLARR